MTTDEQVETIAKMLKAAGWRDTCDGQWNGLKAAIPHIAKELSAAREVGKSTLQDLQKVHLILCDSIVTDQVATARGMLTKLIRDLGERIGS